MEKKSILKKIDAFYTKSVKVIIGDISLDEDNTTSDEKNKRPTLPKNKIESFKQTFTTVKSKFLNLGTPDEKELLYKEVVKREKQEAKVAKQKNKKKTSTKKPVAKKTTTKKEATTSKTKKSETKTTAKKATSTKVKTSKKTTTEKATNTTTKASSKKPETKTTEKKTTTAKKSSPTSKTTVATTKSENKKKAPATTKSKATTSKKPVTKKVDTSKTETSKAKTTKKAPIKKATSTATKTVSKAKNTKKPTATMSKRDTKIALYAKDITKHYGQVDNDFLTLIVKNLGPSIYRRDAELVSCSDPKELDTVRRNFLMKKLGINASQGVLDAAIQDVCTELKGVRTKYRATFYYSLAKKFKKESALS